MMAIIAGLSCVALGMGVLAWLARPELAAAWAARLHGQGDAWFRGELSPQQEAAVRVFANRVRWPLLFFLFAWCFLCGAIITFTRL